MLPGPDDFERAGLKAWPGIEVEYDGSWVRRATLGYTQRANSVQALDPADDADAPAPPRPPPSGGPDRDRR